MKQGLLAATVFAGMALSVPAHALTWAWSYAGNGISAHGSFTTTDTQNAKGYYTITAISGTRNDIQITGLQPAGTGIPGNTAYPVDDLVREAQPQLTGEGFGFSLANGSDSNPFYADFRAPPAYLEFHSNPPDGSGPTTELPVKFTATLETSRQ